MARRKVEVELVLDARNYLDESRKATTETKATEAALEDLGAGADHAGVDLSELAKNTDSSTESLGGLGAKSRDTGEALKALDTRIAATKLSVRDLGIEFATTGDAATGKSLASERSLLGQMTRLRKEVALAHEELQKLGDGKNSRGGLLGVLDKIKDAAGDAFDTGRKIGGDLGRGISDGMDSLGPVLKPVLIGILIAAAAAATPAIGALIAGALTVGVGGLGLAGGVISSIRNPAVESAMEDFKNELADKFFSMTSFAAPMVEALTILKTAFGELNLEGVFRPVAPYVTVLAEGLAGMAREFLPRFGAALIAARPALEIMAQQLPKIGAALGHLFERLAESKGATQGVLLLFGLLTWTLNTLGDTLGWLSDRFFDATAAGEKLSNWLANLFGDNIVGRYFDHWNDTLKKVIETSGVAAISAASLGNGIITRIETPSYKAAEALKQMTGEIKATTDAISGLISTQLGFDQAIVAMEQGFRSFGEEIRRNGRHWTDNTAAAEANQSALFTQIGVLEQLRQKQIAATGDVAGANKEFDSQIDVLLGVARQAGATKEFLDNVAGTYKITIIAKVLGDAASAIANFAVTAFNRVFGGGRASGGPTRAGVSYVVGEHGPEIWSETRDGHITPNNEVRQWQAPASGGWQSGAGMSSSGGGGPIRVELIVTPAPGADQRVMSAITEGLRFDIDTKGNGNVATYLTRRR